MTRLRHWLTASTVVLGASIGAGVATTATTGSAGLGVLAGLATLLIGCVVLAALLVWRALKEEGMC